jgi:hypothetical protein
VIPAVLAAAVLVAADTTSGEIAAGSSPAVACVLALDENSRGGGRRTIGHASAPAIVKHGLTLATDCGSAWRSRLRCSLDCMGICVMPGRFLPGSRRQVALAGTLDAERSEIWIVERQGGALRKVGSAAIPSGQAVLIPAAEGRRFADVQAHIEGSPFPDLPLDGEERVVLFLLVWRPVADGRDGSLYAVLFHLRTAALRLRYVLTLEE